MTELKPTELNLDPIRADSLILLKNEQLILHLEFQTVPDEKMAFRMLDYLVRSYRRFPRHAMRQIVIYLKPSSSTLIEQTVFQLPNLTYQFEKIKLWEQPQAQFMQSVGLLPFAILSQTVNPTETLREVAQNIDTIEERSLKNNITACTEILAGLVLDQQTIHQLFREEIMKESVIYQEIMAQGIQKGKLEGLQQGKLETIPLLLKLGLTVEQIAQELKLEEAVIEQYLQSEQN